MLMLILNLSVPKNESQRDGIHSVHMDVPELAGAVRLCVPLLCACAAQHMGCLTETLTP